MNVYEEKAMPLQQSPPQQNVFTKNIVFRIHSTWGHEKTVGLTEVCFQIVIKWNIVLINIYIYRLK
jgi:hypothetical protein